MQQFNEEAVLTYTKEQIRSCWKRYKLDHTTYLYLRSKSGWGWDMYQIVRSHRISSLGWRRERRTTCTLLIPSYTLRKSHTLSDRALQLGGMPAPHVLRWPPKTLKLSRCVGMMKGTLMKRMSMRYPPHLLRVGSHRDPPDPSRGRVGRGSMRSQTCPNSWS